MTYRISKRKKNFYLVASPYGNIMTSHFLNFFYTYLIPLHIPMPTMFGFPFVELLKKLKFGGSYSTGTVHTVIGTDLSKTDG
jgi:hypothetical protein